MPSRPGASAPASRLPASRLASRAARESKVTVPHVIAAGPGRTSMLALQKPSRSLELPRGAGSATSRSSRRGRVGCAQVIRQQAPSPVGWSRCITATSHSSTSGLAAEDARRPVAR